MGLTNHNPKLPEHDQSTTNSSWSDLGGVDWDSGIFRANADTHYETSCEQLLPAGSKARGNRRSYQAASGDEDLTTSTKIVIERIDDECTTVSIMLAITLVYLVSRGQGSSHQTGSQEYDRVDDTDNPLVPPWPVDAELFWKRQVGSIGTGLVPALSSSAHGAEGDRVPHHLRAMPFVTLLVL